MIIIDDIYKSFDGIRALNGVSFSCKDGTITGLVGPNGSGKSTLLNILSGLINADTGSLKLVGGFSRTFQDSQLWESLTVKDHLIMSAKPRNPFLAMLNFNTEDCEVDSILVDVGLLREKNKLVCDLSYGQRKMLEVGRALATKSKNYLFDEPFAGLSPEMSMRLKEIILREAQSGATIIVVEHDISLIKQICDEVIVLSAGQVLESGKAEDVFNRPTVIEAYLGK
jgi:ABC-type branched-subunit amino acid transport system ATPase component